MNGIVDHNANDPSTRRKSWEIVVKPPSMKLKNVAMSFWCFLTVLISHVDATVLPATRAVTGDTVSSPVIPTASRIASFKARGMCAHALNVCDEDLQLWIDNILSKIQSDGAVSFKMLSVKIAQCTRIAIRLACASLYAMTLKDYNDNIEKLANEMEK